MGGEIQQTAEGFGWQAKDLGLYPGKERERETLTFLSRQRGMLEMCFGKMTLDPMQEGKARVKKRTWETVTVHV